MKQKYLKVMFNTTSRTSSNFKYKIDTEKKSNKTHYEIGKKIRKAIADIGGTMRENLLAPKKV